jgi:hypothetical protein
MRSRACPAMLWVPLSGLADEFIRRVLVKVLPVSLDDELASVLAAVSAARGLDETTLASDVLRKFLKAEQLKRTLDDPALAALYEQLAAEDLALAEEGVAEYHQALEAIDQP